MPISKSVRTAKTSLSDMGRLRREKGEMGMKMAQVLEGVETRNPYNRERDIISICFDSRAAKEDSMFICMKWMNIDSHEFARAAFENGARVIVAEDPVDLPECEIVYVEDSKEAFAKIAANFYGHPADKLKLIGVTGTKGKTSITYFIKSILDYSGLQTAVQMSFRPFGAWKSAPHRGRRRRYA